MTLTRNNVEPTTLLPCPFCGGEARIKHLYVGKEPTHSKVECSKCHIKTDFYLYEFSERNVIRVWNRRAEHD